MTTTAPPPSSPTEHEFTAQIRDIAALLNYHRYHTWLARHSPAGFPDEVLIRPPRAVFAELKTDAKTSKPSPAQTEWLNNLAGCSLEVYLWRPHMLDQILTHLQPATRPTSPGPGAWNPA